MLLDKFNGIYRTHVLWTSLATYVCVRVELFRQLKVSFPDALINHDIEYYDLFYMEDAILKKLVYPHSKVCEQITA